MPSPGYRVSGKKVEVRGTGSRHHQLCGCCSLQLIQNHGAPSHGPPAGVLSPLFFLAKSLLLPKLRGKKKPSKTTWSFPIHSGTAWSSPFPSEPHGPLSPMAAPPRFKSQCPSSFAAPFLTPPTVSYTCQHPSIPPALLGCHSKSGQVWPHGMEPIISKLSRRPCNQGELLPSPILGGVRSHPPGSKHGNSYLTYL